MRTLTITEAVPAAERLDLIREATKVGTVPIQFQPADEADFSYEMRFRDMGAIRALLVTATPYQTQYTHTPIRQSDPDLLSITIVLRGQRRVMQHGRDVPVAPGEFTIQYVNHPFTVGSPSPVKRLQLTVPPALVQLPSDQLDKLTAVPMRPDPGIGALTSKFLLQLASGMDNFGLAEAARISGITLDLLAVRLAHELDSTGSLPPETRKQALLTGVHAFIQQHLGDPALSPAMVATAHHISTRYLHALFHEQGMTVAGWIRQRRLEATRRDLADPLLASRSLESIAVRWGFSSASLFTQAFKRAYGMPPRDYRRQMRMGDHGSLRAD